MKKYGSTMFLRGVVFLIGGAILTLWFLATLVAVTGDPGAYRPILLGLTAPAVPFFFALYNALRLLGCIDKNQAFSALAVSSLGNIKLCAAIIAALFAAGSPYIYYVADIDDAPGVLAMALVIIFASMVIAVFAAVLQKLLQNAMAMKSENDLTV